MKRSMQAIFGATLVTALVVSAGAHHSFAMFDGTKSDVVEGTVKSVQLTNPHSWFVITAPGADGVVKDWNIEGPSPNMLIRRGWKHTDVNAGDKVSFTFHPRKDGTPGGVLVSAKLADGKELMSGAGTQNAK